MKTNRKTLRTVLERLAGMAEKNAKDAKTVCDATNQMLDALLERDFFGTEGQLDPRGDHCE